MKLVYILARELKVWPDQYYQIFQDSGGYLHGSLSDGDLEDCDQEDLPGDPVSIAWDGNNAVVTRAEWQAAVEALKTEQVVDSYKYADVNARFVSLTEYPANAECKIITPKDTEQATELKWPDGATHYARAYKWRGSAWYVLKGDRIACMLDDGNDENWEWRDIDCQDRAELLPRLIPRPTERAVEWDGVGNPHAGTVCEFMRHNCPPKENGQWLVGEIRYLSDCTVVIGGDGCEHIHHPRNLSFRPVRTAEQIAAEEREKAIEEMILTDEKGSLSRTHFCGLLYDAGYRKQPQ